MANIKSAAKRVRQNLKRSQRNRVIKNNLKEAKKTLLTTKKDTTEAEQAIAHLQKVVDKAVKSKVIHKNRARRIKSRLTRRSKP